MPKQIIVTIDPQGGSKVETKGYAGPECKNASKFIEDALGATVMMTPTPEYYQRGDATGRQQAKS
jgi:hypothetical protein